MGARIRVNELLVRGGAKTRENAATASGHGARGDKLFKETKKMKRIFYIMGLALMAFTVSSCSQEDEMVQELQTKDRPMTAEDIRPLQDFAASFARFYTNTEPILQKRMARAKAGLNTASDNQRDIQAMGLQAEMLGVAAQQMFLEIGFTEQELDNLCPLEDKEV